LASLKPASDWAAWLAETAIYLQDIGTAWQHALPAERNEIAVTLFERVTITGDRIEEAIVRPAMAPFFILDSRDVQRKRRASAPHLRYGQPLDVALEDVPAGQSAPPARSHRPARHATSPAPRQPRIPPILWPVVAANARTLGLRQTAKQHGVSHKTVRQIVQRVTGTQTADKDDNWAGKMLLR
jgi:hypothetical protein